MSVNFADIVAKSVHGKIIFFSGYLSYNKTELAKKFGVYMCGIYSVWEIPQSLESTSWLADSAGTRRNRLCCEVVTKGRPTCWSS